jgi:DMSO/TMAO reductase YedYZ molybdopterin-dependent catalytic subunit/thiosulfate reductase cytochrome b subunit
MSIVIAAFGFPLWLRLDHFINILFIGLVIRSGIQIIGAHPRFYWNDGCKPDSNWIRFTRKKIPKGKLWTSMDEEVPVTPWLALPGKDNLGLGRHWHFFSILFWILNGVVYVVLLFVTGEWARLIPTSWNIVPRAWQTFLTYITFHIPPTSDFRPYDPLQQLTYAAVVFLLAPFMLATGAAQSPSIEARFPWYIKIFGGRQSARSLHFLAMIAFVLFIILHTALVLIVHFQNNIRDIVLGTERSSFTLAVTIAIIALVFVFLVYVLTSVLSLRNKRATQVALGAVVDPTRQIFLHRLTSRQEYKPSEISPYFWANGAPPDQEEFKRMTERNFIDWKLELCGLVINPVHLSLDDLRHMKKQSQITKHNCIQGWSGVAEWAGVPLSEVMDLAGVKPEAKFAVFHSYQMGKLSNPKGDAQSWSHPYYEVIDMTLARHPQTILAYEMNDKPLPHEHGAPLRLRVETQLGYKMVKYLRSIEFVEDYTKVGEGMGGFREDFQYYGRGAEI